MKDVTAPEVVEIFIRHDGRVVWVNVDGFCSFRACQIKRLEVIDERPKNARKSSYKCLHILDPLSKAYSSYERGFRYRCIKCQKLYKIATGYVMGKEA